MSFLMFCVFFFVFSVFGSLPGKGDEKEVLRVLLCLSDAAQACW